MSCSKLAATLVVALLLPAADEAAIRALWSQICAAFNHHDAKAWAAVFDETCESWNGERQGPAAEEKYVAGYFARNPGVRYREIRPIGLAFLSADVAVYRTRGQVSGEADGASYEMLEAWVFVKKSGKWRVTAYFLRPIRK